jgi:hypothetical protein
MSIVPKAVVLVTFVTIGSCSLLFGQIKHRFLLADEGDMKVLLVDQFNSSNNWTTVTPNNNRDMQLVGNNRVMVSDPTDGFCELDITTGVKKREVLGFGSVQAATRLLNGNTLLCGDNLQGGSGVTIVEIDSLKNVKKKISFPGYSNVRLMRRTAQNTFLFGANDSLLLESDSAGKILSKIAIKGARNVYMAVRLKNGNTLVSTGYGATLLEIKPDGSVVKTFGGTSQAQAALIKPYFYNSFQVLTNGHIVTTNWEGHGTGHGGVGIQLMEYDTAGTMVWYWKDSTKYSSLHMVIILDSLNTQLLHDDRNGGVLQPVPSPVSVREEGFSPGFPASHDKAVATETRYYDLKGRLIPSVHPGSLVAIRMSGGVYLQHADNKTDVRRIQQKAGNK